MSQLAAYLLGPPRIECDGVPVTVDRRKALALLAYLAVTPAGRRRASVVGLLWPEFNEARGRANLRRTLHALRQAFPGDWLVADRRTVGLRPSANVRVDVTQFRRHLAEGETHIHPPTQVCLACAGPLSKAVALYRGDFLAGFSLRDSHIFDDWQRSQAQALRGELAGALERLVEWFSVQGEFDPALGYACRWLALDPLDERVQRRLMRLYSWSGQRAAALGQYQACVRVLEEELDTRPEERTTALHRAIERGRAVPTRFIGQGADLVARAPFLVSEGAAREPVFVCRERELGELEGFLDETLEGRGQVVFVTGEAGSGKTALLTEFARRAHAAHADVVAAWGHGDAHTGRGDSYLPFRQVLGLLTGDFEDWYAGVMTGEQARRLWRLLPHAAQALVKAGPDLVGLFVPAEELVERARRAAPQPVGAIWLTQLERLAARRAAAPGAFGRGQKGLFQQYSEALGMIASTSPLLLMLDDLQWADAGSISLLFHLGRRLEGRRILVVGAYRPAEVALGRWTAVGPGEGERQRHPLEPVVNEFKRRFGAVEVDLERSAGGEARGREFVQTLLDSEPHRLSDSFREALYRRTGGYPLFTVELLRGMQERGDLIHDGEGRWVEGPALDWETLPARLEGAIAERIERLPTALRDDLAVASVEGETFTAEVVASVRGTDLEEMVRSLSEVLGRGHRLVRARSVVNRGDQRLSRYRFGHILFQQHLYNTLDRVERARLHEAVGTVSEALLREATGARTAAAPELARHFQQAGIAPKAVDYLRQAGERAERLYANEEAVQHFRQALALLEEASADQGWSEPPEEMAVEIREQLGDLLAVMGEHDEAQRAYQATLADVTQEEGIRRARLHRKLGTIDRTQQRYEDAQRAYGRAEGALQEAPGDRDPTWWQERIQIDVERLWLHYYWRGQWREMLALAEQVRPRLEEHGTPSQRITFFTALAGMYLRRDRYVATGETLSACRRALQIALKTEDLHGIAYSHFELGFIQLWAGNLDDAAKQLRTALRLAERTGDVVVQTRCLTYLMLTYRMGDQVEETRDCASRTLEMARVAEMPEYIAAARANLAWLAWREGELAQAEAMGRAAVARWYSLPAGRSSTAFLWMALWVVMDAALAEDRTAQAVEDARVILDPTQQRLPDRLTEALENAISTWEAGESTAARAWLERALAMARELGQL